MIQIIRCDITKLDYVISAINQVKVKSEEDNPYANREAINQFLNNTNNFFLAALDNENVIGYAIAYSQNRLDTLSNMMCLYEIGVLKDYRRKGVGKSLINELKQLCKKESFMKMWVPTNISNKPACALYERTGGVACEYKNEVIYTYNFRI